MTTNFYDLIRQFQAYQDNLLDMTDEQFNELHSDIVARVDNYHDYLDFLDSESARIKAQADTLAKKSKSIANTADRIRGRIADVLTTAGLPGAVGDIWSIVLKTSKYVEIDVPDVGYEVYNSFALDYPELVKVSYGISKSCLKDLLDNDECPVAVKRLGHVASRTSVAFKPRTKGKI